jgi:hypothetical protein
LMLQGYNESFSKFYGSYNDLVCNYKLSLAHMLNDLVHSLCYTVISILALTTGNLVYLNSTKGARRVWPVSRECLLLLGTWFYLHFKIVRGPCCPTLDFVLWLRLNILLSSLFDFRPSCVNWLQTALRR